jgi:hypothetical protein
MRTLRLEDEQGRLLTDMRLEHAKSETGDRIPRGLDTFEVVAV